MIEMLEAIDVGGGWFFLLHCFTTTLCRGLPLTLVSGRWPDTGTFFTLG